MEDEFMKALEDKCRKLEDIRKEMFGWMDALRREVFSPESFLRFVIGRQIDLSRIPGLVGRAEGFDAYRVLGLEKTAADEEIKRRYRELLKKLHPDTAGVGGTGFLLQMIVAAYQQIARERRWQP
jgi:DnaJ-domain-containing protein 1